MRGDSHLSGSALRDEAAHYLNLIYGNAEIETAFGGKNVDILCQTEMLGKKIALVCEVKDYAKLLTRSQIVHIVSDLDVVRKRSGPCNIMIVTRNGVSAGAAEYVRDQDNLFHRSIWELEDEVFGIREYLQHVEEIPKSNGLDRYYIPARADRISYLDDKRHRSERSIDLRSEISEWISEKTNQPIAILGGYGAGKSSFASIICASFAQAAMNDPMARRPILLRLGRISRSAGLDSLLATEFTTESEVKGYSYRKFRYLNERGRFVIILDGFDEMKHAMTWGEFVNQIRELNGLNTENSKVILLGRPSAFSSDDEHYEILRGLRKVEAGYRRLPDWPTFREYELCSFSPSERHSFISRFLPVAEEVRARNEDRSPRIELAVQKAKQVDEIASTDHAVFQKPVHSRILVELSLDDSFDLSKFVGSVTRWSLYEEFFELLSRREAGKQARSPIGAPARLEFMRRVATWLWEENDGASSFLADQIPADVFEGLPNESALDLRDLRREFLSGSFLERKSNDGFFFSHRSFAEFLVAQHMLLNPPLEIDHTRYSGLLKGGVAQFLHESPMRREIDTWLKTLGDGSGPISLTYLSLLCEFFIDQGFTDEFLIPPKYRYLMKLIMSEGLSFPDVCKLVTEPALKGKFDNALTTLFGLFLYRETFDHVRFSGATRDILSDLSEYVVAALISRLIGSVRTEKGSSEMTVSARNQNVLTICRESIEMVGTSHEDLDYRDNDFGARYYIFSWNMMAEQIEKIEARRGSRSFTQRLTRREREAKFRVPHYRVLELLNPNVSIFFDQFVVKGREFGSIKVAQKR